MVQHPVKALSSSFGRLGVLALALTGLAPATIASAQSAPAPVGPRSAHHASKPRAGTPEPTPPAPVQPETPPVPEAPKWPANETPAPPSVKWDSQGLRISAANSSLTRILTEVSTETGTKVEGLSSDERVFGEYGPGQARDVLAQLLHGSGYDFLLVGDQGQGTPREIVLSAHHEGNTNGANPGNNMNRNVPEQPEEDNSSEVDEGPQQPPQPIMRQPMNQPGNPNMRTPQQRMLEMQQQRQIQPPQVQQPQPPQ